MLLMTEDIVGKLMNHLSKPIDDEPGVVYSVAEVRKRTLLPLGDFSLI